MKTQFKKGDTVRIVDTHGLDHNCPATGIPYRVTETKDEYIKIDGFPDDIFRASRFVRYEQPQDKATGLMILTLLTFSLILLALYYVSIQNEAGAIVCGALVSLSFFALMLYKTSNKSPKP